jgi:hypothetical protein
MAGNGSVRDAIYALDKLFQILKSHADVEPIQHVLAVLLQLGRELCSENVGPNVTGTETETEENTVLAFLEFVDEFDSGDHDSCVAERLETEHLSLQITQKLRAKQRRTYPLFDRQTICGAIGTGKSGSGGM